jgi:hypothetical protein
MWAMITRSGTWACEGVSLDGAGLWQTVLSSKTTNVVVVDYVETSGLGVLFPQGNHDRTVTEVGLNPMYFSNSNRKPRSGK